MDIITYPCSNLSKSMLVKGAPDDAYVRLRILNLASIINVSEMWIQRNRSFTKLHVKMLSVC